MYEQKVFNSRSYIDLSLSKHCREDLENRISSLSHECNKANKNIEVLLAKIKKPANKIINSNEKMMVPKNCFLELIHRIHDIEFEVKEFNARLELFVGEDYSGDPTPILEAQKMDLSEVKENLFDILTEPVPSTTRNSLSVPNRKWKSPKKKNNELLIEFSSNSTSIESMPRIETQNTNMSLEIENLTVQDDFSGIYTESDLKAALPIQNILETDNNLPVYITHVDSPSSFYIVESDSTQHRALHIDMQSFYKVNKVEIKSPSIYRSMHYCACFINKTELWYRGLVITTELSESMQVFLVDIGLITTPEYKDLQPLAKQFCNLPPAARNCQLTGIEFLPEDGDWTEEAVNFLKTFEMKSLTALIDDNNTETLSITLITSDHEIINTLMTSKGHARVKAEEHFTIPDSVSELSLSDADDYAEREFTDHTATEEHNRPSTSRQNHAVPHTESIVNDESEYDDEADYDDDFDIKNIQEHDDVLIAVQGYHNKDESQICRHYKGPPSKTCFKGERCKKKHILMDPDGWTRDQEEVTVHTSELILPSPGQVVSVMVTHVASPNVVYLQLKEKEKKRERGRFGFSKSLKDLVSDMNMNTVEHKILEVPPSFGQLVAAKYMDGKWYRARVLDCPLTGRGVEVHFIDYGNRQWVKECDVRELDTAYCILPYQAVTAVLADIQSISNDDIEAFKKARDALNKLTFNVNLNARIVWRQNDILGVELTDEKGMPISHVLANMKLIKLKPYKIHYQEPTIIPG